jgi:thiamine biosynthesis lipoprotein
MRTSFLGIWSAGVILFAGADRFAPVNFSRGQTNSDAVGTLVSITAVAPDKEIAQASIEAGFYEIKRLEQLLSTWIQTSELSQVNASAGRESVAVGPETLELVLRALEMAALTEGGLNIAVGPAVEAWSVADRRRIPSHAELQALKPLVDWSTIQVDRKARTIFLGTLGGIKVNHGLETIDRKGKVIPGLYAAGSDAAGMWGDRYSIRDSSGASAGFALNSGRIAGRNAAKYVGK